jgi:integrase/DNA-binding Lrp family transcriptional regulator
LAQKEYKRPDEKTMLRIINYNKGLAVEIALRLAWNLGLSRDEMHNLKWSDISFAEKIIYLPDRELPMEDEDAQCLEARLRSIRGRESEYVMASDRTHAHMAQESISRIARVALDQGGLKGFTLLDLRHDSVIRMLETHDWPYVARVTGLSVATLYANYSEYFANGVKKPEKAPQEEQEEDVEFKLWKIIREEGTSPEGLALWMAWKMGIPVQDIATLTWDQVDLVKGSIKLPDRKVKTGSQFLAKLKAVKAERAPDSDPHVLLTPRAQNGFIAHRLSRVLRDALIRGGVDITLKDILDDAKRKSDDSAVVEVVAKYGSVTQKEIMEELHLTPTQVYYRIERLIEEGELVKVGRRIYIPGTVVAPDEQYEVIRAYLEAMGGALRGDLAELLHVSGNQCGVILRALVKEGKLKRTGYVYSLPDEGTNM